MIMRLVIFEHLLALLWQLLAGRQSSGVGMVVCAAGRIQSTFDEDDDESIRCRYNSFKHNKLTGNNGLRLQIDSSELGQIIPGRTYTVSVMSGGHVEDPATFGSFEIVSTREDDGSPIGTFQKIPGDAIELYNPARCNNQIASDDNRRRMSASVRWSLTDEPDEQFCILIRAIVHVSDDVWFSDDDSLTLKACIALQSRAQTACCACGLASYNVTFTGLWSERTHPRSWPPESLVHWSNIAGCVHSGNYSLWQVGSVAGQGLKHLSLYGISSELENEISNIMIESGDVRELVLLPGLWTVRLTGATSAKFMTSSRHHLISLASMFGPSPDWFSGVDSLDMCTTDCNWKDHYVEMLVPYDAGVDSGLTYVGNKMPTVPQDEITKITNFNPSHTLSPFYNPEMEIPPLAKLEFKRIATYGVQCPNGDKDSTIPTITLSDNELHEMSNGRKEPNVRVVKKPARHDQFAVHVVNDRDVPECDVTEWSAWSDCDGFLQERQREYKRSWLAVKTGCSSRLSDRRKCHIVQSTHNSSLVRCLTTPWGEWSKCSVSCGHGFKHRERQLIVDYPLTEFCRDVPLVESAECTVVDCRDEVGMKLDMFEKKRICMQPRQSGTCRQKQERYYLNFEARRCERFEYSGCGGNDNRFETIGDCENTCDILLLGKTSSGIDSRCVTLPWSKWSSCSSKCGRSGTQTRYRRYKSKPLALGICGEDMHESRACHATDCQNGDNSSVATAGYTAHESDRRQGICDHPPESGPCKANSERFYFDHLIKTCVAFVYGGCEGNSNNFIEIDTCLRTCANSSGPLHQSDTLPQCLLQPWTTWSRCSMVADGMYTQKRHRTFVRGSAANIRSECVDNEGIAVVLREDRECKDRDTHSNKHQKREMACRFGSVKFTITMEPGLKALKDDDILWADAVIVSHSKNRILSDLFGRTQLDHFVQTSGWTSVLNELRSKKLSGIVLQYMDFELAAPGMTPKRIAEVCVDTDKSVLSIIASVVTRTMPLVGIFSQNMRSDNGCSWLGSGGATNLSFPLSRLTHESLKIHPEKELVSVRSRNDQRSVINGLVLGLDQSDSEGEHACSSHSNNHQQSDDCEVGRWTAWSECSADCGIGFKSRTRNYIHMNDARQPDRCMRRLRDRELCGETSGNCIVPSGCSTTPWSSWSPCSNQCGLGVTRRSRKLISDVDLPAVACMQNVTLHERHICKGVRGCKQMMMEISERPADANRCSLPLKDGSPCRSDQVRYYYNYTIMKCVHFKFGGCNANANNFETEDLCVKACQDVSDGQCTFGDWSEWSVCSERCGVGVEERSRLLTSGDEIKCQNQRFQSRVCTGVNCANPLSTLKRCQRGVQSAWSRCRVTGTSCGTVGTQQRTVKYKGSASDCVSSRIETRMCVEPCD